MLPFLDEGDADSYTVIITSSIIKTKNAFDFSRFLPSTFHFLAPFAP